MPLAGGGGWITVDGGELARRVIVDRWRHRQDRPHVAGGMPAHPSPYVRIRCFLCGHFCGWRRRVTQGGREGRWGVGRGCWLSSVLRWVGPVLEVVCVEPVATERSEGARTTERMRRRQALDLFSPPKFCFTPEPVCLDTERRRPSSVPFSGHYSRAI
jgi:hypothetical protein